MLSKGRKLGVKPTTEFSEDSYKRNAPPAPSSASDSRKLRKPNTTAVMLLYMPQLNSEEDSCHTATGRLARITNANLGSQSLQNPPNLDLRQMSRSSASKVKPQFSVNDSHSIVRRSASNKDMLRPSRAFSEPSIPELSSPASYKPKRAYLHRGTADLLSLNIRAQQVFRLSQGRKKKERKA